MSFAFSLGRIERAVLNLLETPVALHDRYFALRHQKCLARLRLNLVLCEQTQRFWLMPVTLGHFYHEGESSMCWESLGVEELRE
jgi:hypothetical protein